METKTKASGRVGVTAAVAALVHAAVVDWLVPALPSLAGSEALVAMALTAGIVGGLRALLPEGALTAAGAALRAVSRQGIVLVGVVVLGGCGTLQPQSPEAAVDAGCEAALAASTEALAYLQSPEGRDDSASDREAIVEGMRGARDACFAGRAALQEGGSPEARAQALQTALLALAARVPALESDPEFRAALGRLLSASARFSEEVSR